MTIIEIAEETGHVRPMERHDLATVAGLMGLARADPALLAPGALDQALFGSTPSLSAFVAERFGYVVGYALCGAEVAQLYVMRGSRGLGLGAKLDDASRKARGTSVPPTGRY